MRVNELSNIVGLNQFDQKNTNDMTGMWEESLVILLSLEYIYKISALNRNASDILYFIFSLLFMIWRIWNLEILLISSIIHLHETKFREAVLKANSI
jgi:hypothetical protein